jgi:malate permease and related proteins
MLIVLQSILWSVVGVIIYRERIVNANISKLLSLSLYWVGVPLQIFFLARKSNFEQITWLPPLVTVLVLLLGLALALLILSTSKQLFFGIGTEITSLSQLERCLVKVESTDLTTTKKIHQTIPLPITNTGIGSFILASILGNTGFVGLTLIPPLVNQNYWSWIVLYGVAHNILGSYGLGVLVADQYSQVETENNWLNQLQNLLLLPSLWAFVYGYTSRNLLLPDLVETAISDLVLFVVPGAFILIGMQLSKLQQWQSLRWGIFPAIIKMIFIPGITGILLTSFGLKGDGCLVLVLMSGMPTAFASLILAEVYDLNKNVAASSILLSTVSLPIVLLLWLAIF